MQTTNGEIKTDARIAIRMPSTTASFVMRGVIPALVCFHPIGLKKGESGGVVWRSTRVYAKVRTPKTRGADLMALLLV